MTLMLLESSSFVLVLILEFSWDWIGFKPSLAVLIDHRFNHEIVDMLLMLNYFSTRGCHTPLVPFSAVGEW